jgi:hypothetical protein
MTRQARDSGWSEWSCRTRAETAAARPTCLSVVTVLAAVNDASRRLRRWPMVIIDRGCARRQLGFQVGAKHGPQSNKETHGRLDTPPQSENAR